MKKFLLKNSFLVVTVSILIMSVLTIKIAAYENKNFGGSVTWNYTLVGDSMRKDTSGDGVVNWKYSDKGSTHKQWFEIRKGDTVMGNRLIPVVNDGKYRVPNNNKLGSGNNFSLFSKREHVFNPTTYINGVWSADS